MNPENATFDTLYGVSQTRGPTQKLNSSNHDLFAWPCTHAVAVLSVFQVPPPHVSVTMPRLSTQECFAANLKGINHGTAIYRPFQMNDHSGKVGDVAFLDREGTYQWIRNAFHSEVQTQ